MAPSAVEYTTVVTDRTKEPSSTNDAATNDAHPYVLAIDQIRVAITRHREYKDSLADTNETSNTVEGIVEDSYRSRSPVGFTNDAQTIEDIESILNELERNHRIPPPKLSHDSSQIEADLMNDNGQVTAPPVSSAPFSLSLPFSLLVFLVISQDLALII